MALEDTGDTGAVDKGRLCCKACGRSYPILSGIPILTGDRVLDQWSEKMARRDIAAKYSDQNREIVLFELSRHHYLPAMLRSAKSFAQRFASYRWLLDVGAGWAWHWMATSSPNVIAMDFSFEQLLIAKRLLGSKIDENVHLICANAVEMPFKARVIDGIWSVQTLQHLEAPALDRCLRSLSLAVKSGGEVEIYWINWQRPGRVVRQLLGRNVSKETRVPYYFRSATGDELRALFSTYFSGEVEIGYNETIFHPDLRLIHQLPLANIDAAIGRIPFIKQRLARQIVVRIGSPSQEQ